MFSFPKFIAKSDYKSDLAPHTQGTRVKTKTKQKTERKPLCKMT